MCPEVVIVFWWILDCTQKASSGGSIPKQTIFLCFFAFLRRQKSLAFAAIVPSAPPKVTRWADLEARCTISPDVPQNVFLYRLLEPEKCQNERLKTCIKMKFLRPKILVVTQVWARFQNAVFSWFAGAKIFVFMLVYGDVQITGFWMVWEPKTWP